MGERMRQGAQQKASGAPMSRSDADAMRRPQGRQESDQQRQAARDRQRPQGQQAPGAMKMDEQT
jgi:hypothetical protein